MRLYETSTSIILSAEPLNIDPPATPRHFKIPQEQQLQEFISTQIIARTNSPKTLKIYKHLSKQFPCTLKNNEIVVLDQVLVKDGKCQLIQGSSKTLERVEFVLKQL